ncbi:carotenoid oxygenase [Pseudoclavibacter sp. RFBG4]|uniref:carotenoid oxygenase family protein n=1 Tax=Pseudoclavibacter sp. RFBG4 TaxID=2080575 RepID=UPI000CE8B9B0|nr:carotenoid oxygenase family protein [Pseudoclavibacter sp. RFBG4]PPG26419.1 carotenoid oxygenase [Pseudoclavibacter sp. RFBG4]
MRNTGARSPFRKGAFAPVAEEVTAFDLAVTGSIPTDLDGRYLRNGPNPIGVEHARFHYFLGAGMIHGVRLRDGRAEWYRNRWVRQSPVTRTLGEPRRAYSVLGGVDTASNINVVGHAGRILSLGEGGTLPFELDASLETVGPYDFDGTLRAGLSAHPKTDPETGDLHTVGYFSGSPSVEYCVVSARGQLVRSQSIELPTATMMHDFALTSEHVILFDLPAKFSALAAAAGDPFPFRWSSAAKARLGVLSRGDERADVTWFDLDPVWIYHTVNAFEADNVITLDAITHPSMFATRRGSIEGHGTPSLERFTLDLTRGTVVRRRLDDTPQEFPRIDDRRSGRRNRFAYTSSAGELVATWRTGPRELDDVPDSQFDNVLFKHDLDRGSAQARRLGTDAAVGEAIFVARAGSTEEDDGYLLCYVHNPQRNASDLLILSAQDFGGDELARIHLPARIPLGLHGSWIPAHDDGPQAGPDRREHHTAMARSTKENWCR